MAAARLVKNLREEANRLPLKAAAEGGHSVSLPGGMGAKDVASTREVSIQVQNQVNTPQTKFTFTGTMFTTKLL